MPSQSSHSAVNISRVTLPCLSPIVAKSQSSCYASAPNLYARMIARYVNMNACFVK